jgi:hypothetical protein
MNVSARLALAALAGALAGIGLSGATAETPAGAPIPAPEAGEPGPTAEIIGPEGSFRLKPDGENWARFSNPRAIGVLCPEKTCGGDRVACLIQVRGAPGARAGALVPADAAAEFGDGVIRRAPEGRRPAYVAPFVERRFGPNLGRFAEAQAEGGGVRFGWFMAELDAHLLVVNCVAPAARWDAYRPNVEKLIASLEITGRK